MKSPFFLEVISPKACRILALARERRYHEPTSLAVNFALSVLSPYATGLPADVQGIKKRKSAEKVYAEDQPQMGQEEEQGLIPATSTQQVIPSPQRRIRTF